MKTTKQIIKENLAILLDKCIETAISVAIATFVFISVCQAMGFYFA